MVLQLKKQGPFARRPMYRFFRGLRQKRRPGRRPALGLEAIVASEKNLFDAMDVEEQLDELALLLIERDDIVMATLEAHVALPIAVSETKEEHRALGCLFSWNGEWLLSDDAVTTAWQTAEGEHDLAHRLRELPQLR